MNEQTILFSKEGFEFTKLSKNKYSLEFRMQNDKIDLPRIINFPLIKLIYDLNNDIYEKADLNMLNENEATLTLLMKNLFQDIGMPQRFSNVHITKTVNTDNIIFVSKSISKRPEGMPDEASQLPVKQMVCKCDITDPHDISFRYSVEFEQFMVVPNVAEKMIGMIIFKIFKRVKQFIENVKL